MLQELVEEMFGSIEKRLAVYMEGRVYPNEIATTFNFILYDEFSKQRKGSDDKIYSLNPVFVGQYFVDPASPIQTRVFSHHGTEACSPIPIRRGVIGRAVRTGADQYVPDVTKDSEHVGCDPNMGGSELVLISWSEPYGQGRYQGKSAPMGVLDLDFNVKNVLSIEDTARLRRIWDTYGPKIFPGQATFEPKESLSVR